MDCGRKKRLGTLFSLTGGRALFTALDHGVTAGALHGLGNVPAVALSVLQNGANAVVLHKGMADALLQRIDAKPELLPFSDAHFLLHLSASTKLSAAPHSKILCSSVEDAVRLGAEAVSVHVTLGVDAEPAMLTDLGRVASEAHALGMPLMAMMYARELNESTPCGKNSYNADILAHCARVAAELGADMVKLPYFGNVDAFARMVFDLPIPVLVAGGEKMDSDKALFTVVREVLAAGAAGLCMGRNIFQHRNPQGLTRALRAVIADGISTEEACRIVEHIN